MLLNSFNQSFNHSSSKYSLWNLAQINIDLTVQFSILIEKIFVYLFLDKNQYFSFEQKQKETFNRLKKTLICFEIVSKKFQTCLVITNFSWFSTLKEN